MKTIQSTRSFCLLLLASLLVLVSCAAPAAAPPESQSSAAAPELAPAAVAAASSDADQGNTVSEAESAEDSPPEWVMAAPVICAENPQYSFLASEQFWDGTIEENGTMAFAKIAYINEIGQRFDIFIYGTNSDEGKDAIQKYVNEGKVCLEAVESNPDANVLYTSSEMAELQTGDDLQFIEDALVEIVVTNEWRAFFAKSPERLAIWFGLKMPELLAATDGWAKLAASIESGRSDIIEPELLEGLRDYAEELRPGDKAMIRDTSPDEFVNWFFFEFAQTDTSIHFSFDPKIAATADEGIHEYQARCSTKSAFLEMRSTLNEPVVSFWKESSRRGHLDIPVPQGGDPFSEVLAADPGYTDAFDALVKGGERASEYTINGGWVQGSGCR